MLNTKPEDRTFDWIKRECIVAAGLYDKVLEDLEPEDTDLRELIPTPLEYCENHDLYKVWWDLYKQAKQDEFTKKHADTIRELDRQKEDNFRKLQMTEDEKIAFYVEQDKEIAAKRARGEFVFLEPPQEYLDDQKALRGFFNCTLAVYMALLSAILDLIMSDEFSYIDIDYDPEIKDFADRIIDTRVLSPETII